MSEPITWQALEHIKAMLVNVTIANGYYTDLGAGEVSLEPTQRPEGDQILTVVASTDIPVSQTSRSFVKSAMEVVIETSVPFGDGENPERIAHRVRADLIQVLKSDLRGGPIGFDSLEIIGSRIGTPEDGAAAVSVQVTARAGLTESKPPAN